ncbi:MAG: glycogen synthase GlgA [Paenibacillaceae bacterium]|nr:glycogen synthase GlgA [Paenibacillaceae bacterium]
MNVLFAASEAVPLVKSGGLADVIGSLPQALQASGVDVRVILPKYEDIPERYKAAMETIATLTVRMGWREQYCGIQRLAVDGVVFYFIDNEYYFKRRGLYGYGDEAERFVFFSFAVLAALPHLGFAPDIIHCHDWQTGLIPFMLKKQLAGTEFYAPLKTVFTIHNLKYAGHFPREVLKDLLSIGDEPFTYDGIGFYDGGSCLKAGLMYADWLTTVSETYAREIQTPEYGEQLDGVLRWRGDRLTGIVNGIDTDAFDPMTDPHIPSHYRDSLAKKRQNKAGLQRRLGLAEREEPALIGVVSRLVQQKGFDLIEAVFPDIMRLDVQLVVLGTGEARYEQLFRDAAWRYPQRVSAQLTFDDALARHIYAASDLFLMPSLFEPCGLGQLIALRYRSIPIVRETGGLKDTVEPFNEYTGEGRGFSFTHYDAGDMLYTIRRAVAMYGDGTTWPRLMANLRGADFSWNRAAKQYAAVYRQTLDAE